MILLFRLNSMEMNIFPMTSLFKTYWKQYLPYD